ncbi:MAG: AAA family ATPase [Candidatus Gastranaerophilales bacterium]|nr:AAA family ATPase [Candidatus Gastranaerophilales bacterium]
MKAIIIDKNEQSREIVLNILKNIENTKETHSFENFPKDFDYGEIDLVVFDIDSKNSKEILEKIQKLKSKYKNLNFIALSYEINSQLVNQTLSAGVLDFLLKPILSSILEASIKKINTNQEKKAKTICAFSNKGGIGKTSLITNLAWEIYKKTNEKICILDLSFNSEDASAFLNVKQKYNIDYILSNLSSLNKECFLSMLGKYKDSEIYVLEAQEEILPEAKFSAQIIAKIINSLKNMFDFIIIDTTSLINETNVAILNNSDLILLLANTNSTSIKNCQKCYELFDKIGYDSDKIKLVINRFIDSAEFNLEQIEKTLNKKIFDTIPNNYLTLIDAINQASNVEEVNPQSNIAKAYSRLAQNVLDIDFTNLNSKANYNHGIFNLLKRMGEE